MARLVQYLEQLSILLGQQADMRFLRVEKASLNVLAKAVGGGTATRVARRVDAVRNRQGPADAMRAYHRIDEMVYEDGGTAKLSGPALVLFFPGTAPAQEPSLRLVEQGSITGRLYALAELSQGISARIRPLGGGNVLHCTATDGLGRQLRELLFEPVRASGRGTWVRGEEGNWDCEKFEIDEIWQVKSSSVRDAIDELRRIEAEWPEDPLSEMLDFDEATG